MIFSDFTRIVWQNIKVFGKYGISGNISIEADLDFK